MWSDRSRERRERAERVIFVKQMVDWKNRASVLGMTQRWLDLAEPREPDAFDLALRLRAIQTKIGRELREQLDLPCELPHQLFTLLMQLNAPQDGNGHEATASERPPAPQSAATHLACGAV